MLDRPPGRAVSVCVFSLTFTLLVAAQDTYSVRIANRSPSVYDPRPPSIRLAVDRVLVMDRGKIVEVTTPAQLLEASQHEVTQRLVAAQLPDVGIVPVF